MDMRRPRPVSTRGFLHALSGHWALSRNGAWGVVAPASPRTETQGCPLKAGSAQACMGLGSGGAPADLALWWRKRLGSRSVPDYIRAARATSRGRLSDWSVRKQGQCPVWTSCASHLLPEAESQ